MGMNPMYVAKVMFLMDGNFRMKMFVSCLKKLIKSIVLDSSADKINADGK
jgi:hypothetical protein